MSSANDIDLSGREWVLRGQRIVDMTDEVPVPIADVLNVDVGDALSALPDLLTVCEEASFLLGSMEHAFPGLANLHTKIKDALMKAQGRPEA